MCQKGGWIVLMSLFISGTSFREELKDCSRYTSYGYGYKDTFEIQSETPKPNYIFHVDFYVKTVSDAHVFLKGDLEGNVGIEIVIGGGSNTFSQIRMLRNEAKAVILTKSTKGILTDDDFRWFEVTVDKEGIISVANIHDEFLNWKIDDLFPIRYFAFGSWTDVKADWRYGCHQETGAPVMDVVPKIYGTDLERLKASLLTMYNANSVPCELSDTLEVRVHFDIHSIDLNESRGELTVRGSSVLKWHDSKLHWNPEEFGGIKVMFLPPFDVWTPPLKTLNILMAGNDFLFDMAAAGVSVTHNGSMTWRPPFKSVSMCEVNIDEYPFDVHNCSVYIGFWMEPKNLRLTIDNERDQVGKDNTGSMWKVLRVSALNGKDDEGNDNYNVLYVELERAQFVIIMEFVNVAILLSLGSFFIPSNRSVKFYVSCGSEVLLVLSLLLICLKAPIMPDRVPKIIKAYSWIGIVGLFPIAVFVLLETLPRTLNLTWAVEKIVYSKVTDWFLRFPQMVRVVPPSSSTYCNLKLSKIDRDTLNATRLRNLIERFCFLIYLTLVILVFTIL